MTTEQQLLAEGDALRRRMQSTTRVVSLVPTWDEMFAWERQHQRRWTGRRPTSVSLRYGVRPSDGRLVPMARAASTTKPIRVVRLAPSTTGTPSKADVTVDAVRRTISGVASSRVADRVYDVIEPSGVTFQREVPLLMHHDTRLPVGTVRLQRDEDRILFTASLPVLDDPGPLKVRVDEAWQSVTAGLIKGVSIGFLAVPGTMEHLATGGTRFKQIEICELSLTPVPMHPNAIITAIGAKRLEPSVVTSERRTA